MIARVVYQPGFSLGQLASGIRQLHVTKQARQIGVPVLLQCALDHLGRPTGIASMNQSAHIVAQDHLVLAQRRGGCLPALMQRGRDIAGLCRGAMLQQPNMHRALQLEQCRLIQYGVLA